MPRPGQRYVRTGRTCTHCRGQVVQFLGGDVACLACNREPDEPRQRYDPDREDGRPDPVRRQREPWHGGKSL